MTPISPLDDIRVLIVASSPLARAGLAALLGGQAGLRVIGQVADDPDLPESVEIYRPDVVVWDMGWETRERVERLAEVGTTRNPVLALVADKREAAEGLRALLNAGARGILLQDANAEQLAAALYAIARGLVVLDESLIELSPQMALPPPAASETVEMLTPREAEVLYLIAEGLPNKTIASRLNISEHTVKFHVNAILTKLGAQSRTEAVVRATRLGLIAL